MAKQALYLWTDIRCTSDIELVSLLTRVRITIPTGSCITVNFAETYTSQHGETYHDVALLFESAERDGNGYVIVQGRTEDLRKARGG